MKKTLAFIIFLLFLLLAWLSWSWYKGTVACCEKETATTVKYGPLIFDCNTKKAITNDLWPNKRAEIIGNKKQGKKLLIVAPYFNNENEEIGITRAKNVAKLFQPEIALEQIEFGTRKGGDCKETMINDMHESRYKWVIRNDEIIEHLYETHVFYHYDSDHEVKKANIDAYFTELATFLKESSDKIIITGHTDSDGTDEYNIELGLKRAEEFKSHLTGLGVSEAQIKVASEGKAHPMADNTNLEGRRKNRRVEIKIIDKN